MDNIEKDLLDLGFSEHNINDIMKVVKKKELEQGVTNISCRGNLEIQKIYEDGTRELHSSKKNEIVAGGLTALTQIFGNAPSPTGYAQRRPVSIAVGTGTPSTTALGTEVFEDTFDSTTYPTASSVRFEMILQQGEANGSPLQEAGLFSADGTMIARQSFQTITKNSSFQLAFVWSFTFADAG